MYSQPVVLNAAKNAPQKPSPAGILRKRLIVLGIERIELAKMIGRTPPRATLISAHNTLSILNRDSSFAVLHECDNPYDSNKENYPERYEEEELCAAVNSKVPVLTECVDNLWELSNDTCKKEN